MVFQGFRETPHIRRKLILALTCLLDFFFWKEREIFHLCSAQDDVDLILTINNVLLATERKLGLKLLKLIRFLAKFLEKSLSKLNCTVTIGRTVITPECNCTLNIAGNFQTPGYRWCKRTRKLMVFLMHSIQASLLL